MVSLPGVSKVSIALNLSLFVKKSHRSLFDPESKLWKLALLVDVFYWKTRSHLSSITYISAIEKRTKNWLSDSSEVQRSLRKVAFWVACQRKKAYVTLWIVLHMVIPRLKAKVIPIKCFVSYRPPSRKGGSVGREKKEWTHEGFCQWGPGYQMRKLGYVVLSFVIRWYNMNSTTKCLKRLQKRSVDVNLRQLVTIGVKKTKSCACKLKYLLLYKWLWFFFSLFQKNRSVGR